MYEKVGNIFLTLRSSSISLSGDSFQLLNRFIHGRATLKFVVDLLVGFALGFRDQDVRKRRGAGHHHGEDPERHVGT